MLNLKSNQMKLYILITLCVVFVVFGYFRFFHQKGKTASVPLTSPAAIRTDTDRIETKNRIQVFGNPISAVHRLPRTDIRNLFAPPRSARPSGLSVENPGAALASPLKLGGTIVGGDRPIAIINDKFLRPGDRIGEYRIVRITKNHVLLRSDTQEVVLEVLTDIEK